LFIHVLTHARVHKMATGAYSRMIIEAIGFSENKGLNVALPALSD